VRPIQSSPLYSVNASSILTLYTHLRLGLRSGSFLSVFPTNNIYEFQFSPFVLHGPPISFSATYHSNYILSEEYKSRSSSLRNFLHSPVTSSLFGPNILLNTLFSNTLSLCSSLNVRDQVAHPYRTKGKIKDYHILIFTFFDSRWEDRSFWTAWQEALPEFTSPHAAVTT
jgi:hypothetical protein